MTRCKSFGSGPEKILVMHTWFSDNSVYAPLLPHLNPSRFTFVFLDLRGYGGSKNVLGTYSLEEAVNDAISAANALHWDSFHVIGHSMSGMIAQKLALDHPRRIKSIIGISPVPASGEKRTPELISFLETAALQKEGGALECIQVLTNRRYSNYIASKMADKWHDCSTSEARLAYLHMFSYTDFSPSLKKGLTTPMLFLMGEYERGEEDSQLHKKFLQWYPNAKIEWTKHSGHFPMQEAPLYLASQIEHFLEKQQKPSR